MTAPGPASQHRPRRVLVTYERGDGGPVAAVAGDLVIAAGTGVYPRNGYVDLRADWPSQQRISILNRRVVEIVNIGRDEDPKAVVRRLASGGDPGWP